MNTFVGLGFKVPLAFRFALRTPVLSDFLVRRLNVFSLAMKYGVHHRRRMTREIIQNYREPHPDYASRKGVAMFPRLIPITPKDEAYAPIKTISEALRTFDVPTLFLVGDKDPVTSRVDPKPIIERMPNARIQVVMNAGHFLQEDQPEDVTGRILEFLEMRTK